MKRLWILTLWVIGCAAPMPRPQVLLDLDQARSSPAVRGAEATAPQAYSHAERLRARAEQAHKTGDSASAQILAEHALAAYQRATILSRLAVAEARRGEAESRLSRSEQQLRTLDEQQQRLLAETENIELRTRVLRDTFPLPTASPASPARERARFNAARSLALQARLLCASARLLEPERPSLSGLITELDQLDDKLVKVAYPAPLDHATQLRSKCLKELSLVRRPRTLSSPASSATDQLLMELSTASYEPARDDRGVAVTLRSVYGENGSLSAESEDKLLALGRVAAAHREFPVLVVLHSSLGQAAENRGGPRLQAAAETLKRGGAERIATAFGGDASPHVPPARPGARERNERLEVVFVAPSSS